jgi:hypothetical protein
MNETCTQQADKNNATMRKFFNFAEQTFRHNFYPPERYGQG